MKIKNKSGASTPGAVTYRPLSEKDLEKADAKLSDVGHINGTNGTNGTAPAAVAPVEK